MELVKTAPKMAQKGPSDPPKGSGATFERSHFWPVLGPCWTPSRSQDPAGETGLKWAKPAENGFSKNKLKMAQKGPLDPPQGSGSGTTFENFHF